jgi:hypothetical protein
MYVCFSNIDFFSFYYFSIKTLELFRLVFFCFSLKSKSKGWMARNQNHVSEWSDMSIRGLLIQWASTIKIQLNVLV